MSKQNVELVRQMFQAVHTREPEEYLRYFAPDVALYPLGGMARRSGRDQGSSGDR
jgi:hypothetical protein